MNFKELNLIGFTVSEDTDKMNSIYYDSEETEDNWIRINNPINNNNFIIITYVFRCEEVAQLVVELTEENIKNMSDIINTWAVGIIR